MKYVQTILLTIALLTSSAQASQISRLALSKLADKSVYIVLGKVTHVRAKDVTDHVTISVASTLKGKLKQKEITFVLVTRGGIKDFDPQLKVGDTGVFFLNESNGTFKKTFWGSVAIFNKNNFK